VVDIRSEIQRIEQELQSVRSGLDDTKTSINDLEKRADTLKKLAGGNKEYLDSLNKIYELIIKKRDAQKQSDEQERKALENIMGKHKTLEDHVKKLAQTHARLAGAVYHSAKAYESFTKSADIGKTIQHIGGMVGSFIPGFKTFGTVLGFVVGAAIKAQDRIQGVNKTIIDLSASTGRFGEGMALANKETLDLTAGFAKYGQSVGMSSQEVQNLAGTLGSLGFSMEEMGLDKQTGQIKTLSSAINENASEWGALSTTIGVARATGLDYNQVASVLQIQIKDLGDTVQGTGKTFAALSIAANRSRLSTSTLLPVLQQVQSSFKNIGLDSAKAVEMLGKAGEAAKKAGVGAGVAVDVMGKAIRGMAEMDFGQMAFLGQQLGMGGGLAAGFQFRGKIGGKEGGGGGAEIAQQIGQVIGKIMGGSGELISEEQAKGNDRLAAIRVGQEKLAQQMFGFSQSDARVFINVSKQLSNLNAAGQGDSEEAKKLNKRIAEMQMSESDYRKKTLTGQQKVQNLLELISTLVGNAVALFVRAFAGGAAKSGSFGKDITDVLKAINTGQGLDEMTDRIANIGITFEKEMGPTIEKMGNFMGKHWILTMTGIFGGGFIKSASGIVLGALGAFFNAKVMSNMLRGLLSTGQVATRGATEVAGGAVRGIFGTTQLGETTKATTEVAKTTKSFLSLSTTVGRVTSMLGVGGVLIGATEYLADALDESADQYKKTMNRLTGETNAYLMSLQDIVKVQEKQAGMTQKEAEDLYKRITSGTATKEEEEVFDRRRDEVLDLIESGKKKIIKSLQEEIKADAASQSYLFGAKSSRLGSARLQLQTEEMGLRGLETFRQPASHAIINQSAEDRRAAQVQTQEQTNKDLVKAITSAMPGGLEGTLTDKDGKIEALIRTISNGEARAVTEKNNGTPPNAR